jgi:hypothetical protein
MDVNQLQHALQVQTDDLAKKEAELMQLTRKVNELKRTIPEAKRKMETLKRDLLAQTALTRRRQLAAEQGKNTT